MNPALVVLVGSGALLGAVAMRAYSYDPHASAKDPFQSVYERNTAPASKLLSTLKLPPGQLAVYDDYDGRFDPTFVQVSDLPFVVR